MSEAVGEKLLHDIADGLKEPVYRFEAYHDKSVASLLENVDPHTIIPLHDTVRGRDYQEVDHD